MLKNYIKIAWRNLLKHKVYSAINIFGLALGMAVTLMIGLWIANELDYNSYFKNSPQIAQVYQTQTFNGNTGTSTAIPRPLEFALREKYASYFEHIVMASWEQPMTLRLKDKVINQNGISIQEEAPKILNLTILKGENNGLKEKNSIMISQLCAKALFGNTDPLGKIVNINDRDDMMVTAVYQDIPQNNSFSGVRFFIPWKHFIESEKWLTSAKDEWDNNSFQLYVQVAQNTGMPQITQAIAHIKSEENSTMAQFKPELFLLPMNKWHLYSNFENGIQTGGRIENVWLFGIIGAFVLLLACINFMNLSTARSEKRAMEVGIRKTIGSTKGQLIKQFLSESFLVVILAFILALGLAILFLNSFNSLADKQISFPWDNVLFWIVSLLFIAFTALISGSYPALYLSSFHPIKVLKGTFKAGKMAALPRKILVVTQFSVSVALIIGTLIVMSQIEFSKNRPVGYKTEELIQISVMSFEFVGKDDLMRDQFKASGAVTEMATSSSPTTDVWSNQSGFSWEGKPEGFQEDLANTKVSYEYVETLGIKMAAGRGFSRKFATDSSAVILNQAAADYMGLQNPVGKFITQGSREGNSRKFEIIGVMENVVTQSPYEPVKQAMYVFDRYGNASYWNLRLNPEKSVRENLTTIEDVFKKNFPNTPFNYDFIDQEYAKKFAEENRIASLAKVFTILAILISCLGLFGLASFMAEQRTKEIGVRKVLGASVANLWLLLSKDFVLLVIIALFIASPIAYYMMSQWIQKFSYRTDISLWIFLIAAVGALTITLITVSFQAIKAAIANPVKSLRTE
jgi:ABC-type antimicrobial peptide transport system permease subunit